MNNPLKKKNRPKLGIYLKPRDLEVMRTLWRYRFIRESTLHRLCFPTVLFQRKVQARLKKLAEEDYIDRRFPPMIHRDNNGHTDYIHQDRREVMYWIERRGVEEGVNGGNLSAPEQVEQLRFIKNLSGRSEAYLNHRLDLSDIQACLELALRQTPDVLLASWYDEYEKDENGPLLQAKVLIPRNSDNSGGKKMLSFTLCPDACLILEDTKSPRQDLFFVEVDEGTESARKRWRSKVQAYCAYMSQGFEDNFSFQGQGFRVLVVTRSRTGKEQVKRQERLLKTTRDAGGRGQFWFTTFDRLMPEGKATGKHLLAGKIWQWARKPDQWKDPKISLHDHLFGRDRG